MISDRQWSLPRVKGFSVAHQWTRVSLMRRHGISQSLESFKANLLFDDLMKFRDVFPEAIPCELTKDKGTRHEIDLKPGSK